MADKTLPPTAKRLLSARKEGKVAKSTILTSGVSLTVCFYLVLLFAKSIGSSFTSLVTLLFLSQSDLGIIFEKCVLLALFSAGLFITPITIAAVSVELVQLGGKVFVGANWNRPFSQNWSGGINRVRQGLISSWQPLLILLFSSLVFLRLTQLHGLMNIANIMVAFLLGVGGFDWYMKYRQTYVSLRMDRKEIADEHKDSEGDPHVKAHRRMMQRALAYESLETRVKRAKVIFVEKKHAGRRGRKIHY